VTTKEQDAVEQGIRAIVAPKTVFEIRALRVTHNGSNYESTWSGYFDNPGLAAQAIAPVDGRARGIYLTLNPTIPALLSRASNRLREVRKDDQTTNDGEILARARLLVVSVR
jgi:hypothetical protein